MMKRALERPFGSGARIGLASSTNTNPSIANPQLRNSEGLSYQLLFLIRYCLC